LNLELINIILQGITVFSAPSVAKDLGDDKNRRFTAVNEEHKRKNRVRRLDLDRIRIKNALELDGAKADTAEDLRALGSFQENLVAEFDEDDEQANILEIFEDVKVYDYAFKNFAKLRDMDGITYSMI
jgi:hypothetical protein